MPSYTESEIAEMVESARRDIRSSYGVLDRRHIVFPEWQLVIIPYEGRGYGVIRVPYQEPRSMMVSYRSIPI